MALLEEDVVLVGTTEEGGSKVALPITRVNNVEGLGRYASTAYAVGDIVYVDSNMKIALKCITGGTTSAEELDFSNATIGEGVIDGGVVWKVIPRGVMQGSTSTTNGVEGLVPAPMAGDENKALCGDGSFKVLPIAGGGTGATNAANARTNLGLATAVTAASISGKNITLTKADGTTQTMTTQDTNTGSDMTDYIIESYRNGTEWYEVYKSGKVRQGGNTTTGSGTLTLLKPYTNASAYNLTMGYGYYNNNLAGLTPVSGTQFKIEGGPSDVRGAVTWQAEGQGA